VDPNKEDNKSWKKVAIENTYEAARHRKEQLLLESSDGQLLVKIRRCGPDGSQFKLKVWHPDFVKPKNKKNKRSK
jgi:hypothetical protein